MGGRLIHGFDLYTGKYGTTLIIRLFLDSKSGRILILFKMGQGKGGKCRIKCTNIQFWVPLVIRKFRVYLESGFIVVVPLGGWRRGKVLWEWGRERKGTLQREGKGKDRTITATEMSLEIGNLSSIFQKSIPKDTYHIFPRHCL